jgi:hypothetical protein
MEGKGEEGRGPIQSFCPRAQLVVWPPLHRAPAPLGPGARHKCAFFDGLYLADF